MSAPQPRIRTPRVVAVVTGVLLVAIGAQAWQTRQQHARIETLGAEVRALERSVQDVRREVEPAQPPGARAAAPERPPLAAHAPWVPPLAADVARDARAPATVAPGNALPSGEVVVVRTALLDMLESDDPDIRTRVQAVIERTEAQMRDQRQEARQQRWEQDTLTRIDKLAADTRLSQAQEDALFTILTVARDRASDAFREARENQNFGEAHEKADASQAEADAEARKLLSDPQYAGYERMRDEETERRGFRRGAPAR